MKRLRVGGPIAVLFVMIILVETLNLATATTSPTMSSVTIANHQTSLTLPSGGQMYIFALASGGGKTGFFTNSLSYIQSPWSVVNANGNLAAAVAITTSDTNSFTTSASTYTIAGASVSGFGPIPKVGRTTPILYPSINAAPGANGATALPYVNPAWPGSLVVVVAIAGGEQCISSITGLPGLVIDASNSNSGSPAIVIGHAYISSGQYQVTEVTSQCGTGQTPNNGADLIETFIFLPSNI